MAAWRSLLLIGSALVLAPRRSVAEHDADAERRVLVANERLKLTVEFASRLGVGLTTAGFIFPVTALVSVKPPTVTATVLIASGLVASGLTLYGVGRHLLRGLR